MGYAPIRIAFPDASQVFRDKPDEQRYVSNVVQVTRSELDARTRDDSARSSILMRASDDSVWALTVSTAGVVTATKVR
jgi:hypothetical protein